MGAYAPAVEDQAINRAHRIRHRIVTNFNAEAEGVTPVDLVKRLLDSDR